MSLFRFYFVFSDFPDSSAGKESACSAGDPSSIPGSGRSAGEGIGSATLFFRIFPYSGYHVFVKTYQSRDVKR